METTSQDLKESNTGQDDSIEEFANKINDFLTENPPIKAREPKGKMCFSCTGIFRSHSFTSHVCSTKWQCKICGICFKSHKHLESHVQSIHKIGKKSNCRFCGSEVYNRRQHERQFHQSKQPCPDCGKEVRNLKHHFQTIHGPADLKKFVCEICERRFLLKEKLVAHSVVHSEERKYECKFKCGFACNTSGNLKKHESSNRGCKIFRNRSIREENLS